MVGSKQIVQLNSSMQVVGIFLSMQVVGIFIIICQKIKSRDQIFLF